jgi:branched-chain amino acid transport system substrate-binding protein
MYREEKNMNVRKCLCTFVISIALLSRAEAREKTVTIGVLTDLSGVYSDLFGEGSINAAKMAVEDFGGSVAGKKIEILPADHHNKVDVGVNRVREWIDGDGLDVLVDVPNSAVSLAVNRLIAGNNKVFLATAALSTALTGDECSANTVQWTLDSYFLANAAAYASSPGDRWFFITADYAFGLDLEANGMAAVKRAGGSVAGSVHHPLGAPDFASLLLQAQSSGANIIGLADAGADATNVIKQASEFGLDRGGTHVAGFATFINNVHALGLNASQGLVLASVFYWDQNDASRQFAERFSARHSRKLMPNEFHASVYSAITHYLKAVAALGDQSDGRAVVSKMKELPTDDPLYGKGSIRLDGRKLHPGYIYQTKTVSESKGSWDYLRVIKKIDAEVAFRPLAGSGCKLVEENGGK